MDELAQVVIESLGSRLRGEPVIVLAGEFAGAMVRISHNSTKKERKSDRRRSVFLRVCPESCPEHSEFFGLREDAESINSTTKSRLRNDRVRYKGRIRNRLAHKRVKPRQPGCSESPQLRRNAPSGHR